MMSRRRRMNAAASRPAIVRARAGEDRRPPVFGKSGLQSAVPCESPAGNSKVRAADRERSPVSIRHRRCDDLRVLEAARGQ